ncbi:MAG: hypothetical protein ACREGG_04640 [Candidatus Saccharimonadales bacterium]
MANLRESVKHFEIQKARSQTTAVVAIAVAVTIFSLVSTKSLLSQGAYQRRVINTKHTADAQLEANVNNAKNLVTQYNQVFEGASSTNFIGGQNDKSSSAIPPNGDNARIVLDALPSTYDYPALITSVNKMVNNDGVTEAGISGDDQSATQSSDPVANPQPVPMQLTVSGQASYANVQQLINDFERSIRPFDITSLELTGSESSMNFNMTLTTYFQPPKSLDYTTKEIH